MCADAPPADYWRRTQKYLGAQVVALLPLSDKVSVLEKQSHRNFLSSVQFSDSVLSDSLWPHRLQHARPPCPSPTPEVRSNSCPLSRWCHPTISSSVIHFSSCLQSFPASGSLSQFFASSGQSIGVSGSASVLSVNIQDWFPLGLPWLDLLAVQGTLKSLLHTTVQKHQFFSAQLSL